MLKNNQKMLQLREDQLPILLDVLLFDAFGIVGYPGQADPATKTMRADLAKCLLGEPHEGPPDPTEAKVLAVLSPDGQAAWRYLHQKLGKSPLSERQLLLLLQLAMEMMGIIPSGRASTSEKCAARTHPSREANRS